VVGPRPPTSPLENQDIAAPGSLDLLLNSLQLQQGDRVVWDESLHAQPAAAWNPLRDRVILALIAQLLVVGLLLVLSRGRRSGPLRPMPTPARSSPMEFVRSLGGLYRSSGANDVPVTIAYERFRSRLAQHYGIAAAQAAEATLAATLTQRFGVLSLSLQRDLEACENAGRLTNLKPRQALALVKALAGYNEQIARQADSSTKTVPSLAKDRGTIGPQHEHTDSRRNPTGRRTA
jgi:hypothetical protein